MSYQVLARKWRPQNFKQMVGQEHVLRALMNALDSDRLHHAYLFTGTRGVGKTTIARILAKCLNCETGITSTPCGECNSCNEIVSGNFLDLIEVDAASRTKVEDTRELLENVQYAPTRARFKVYLIDEVHMLTGHSFNALLKTLEEPPPHVKFLFATTDPQKLPATILSRCLQFNLKRMPIDMITGHLDYLLQQESIKSEANALRLLARAADGSMRDALSLLDQSIAYSGADINEASVRDMLGTISNEPLIDLIKLVVVGEGAKLLHHIEDLSSVTPDFAVATDALIALLHQLAVQQVVPDAINEEQAIADLAKKITKEEVQLFYQIALQGRRDLPLTPDPRSGFEMLLLRMLSFRPLREGMQLAPSTLPDTASEAVSSQNTEETKKKTVIPEAEPVSKRSSLKADVTNSQTPVAEKEIIKPHTEKPLSTANIAQPSPTNNSQEVPPWEDVPAYLDQNETSTPVITPPVINTLDKNHPSKAIEPKNLVANTVHEQIDTTPAVDTAVDNNDSPSIEDLILGTHLAEPTVDEALEEDISIAEVVAVPAETSTAITDTTPTNSTPFNPNQPWHEIVPQLKLSGRANELIKHCLLQKNENGIISLLLNKSREDLYADNTKHEIQAAISHLFGDNTQLELSIANADAGTPNDQISADKGNLETPAQRSERKKLEIQQQAEQNIENDPFVNALKNRFGAQLVPGSVQPKSN